MSANSLLPLDAWRPLSPHQGADLLHALKVPWWIAGGWALDLFMGTQGRPHKDLDIGLFRRDVLKVTAALPSWEFFQIKNRMLSPLAQGELPRQDVHSLWCKREDSRYWELELMLDESRSDHWVFRRDSSIERSFASAVRRDAVGTPYLAPEIQLLYKARATRAEDQSDFDRVLPRLAGASRRWLRESLAQTDPHHAWNKYI